MVAVGALATLGVVAAALDPNLIEGIRKIFSQAMERADNHGANFLRRPVFAKSHGCVKARFDVDSQLPAKYRIGAFAEAGYNAWIRFSNDGPYGPDSPADGNNPNRGMSIKLVGVAGPKILPGFEDAVTQDFLMENNPVFFVDTAQDFLQFIQGQIPGDKQILAVMSKNVLPDPLDGQYWTPTPYSFGSDVVKYMVKPCIKPEEPSKKPTIGDHYMRQNMADHLAQGKDVCMSFEMLFQTDPDKMPVDKATVRWPDNDEKDFVKFATITIPANQNINDKDQMTLCENLSFTGWHTTEIMRPLGSLNEARLEVYAAIAKERRDKNKLPSQDEPTKLDLN